MEVTHPYRLSPLLGELNKRNSCLTTGIPFRHRRRIASVYTQTAYPTPPTPRCGSTKWRLIDPNNQSYPNGRGLVSKVAHGARQRHLRVGLAWSRVSTSTVDQLLSMFCRTCGDQGGVARKLDALLHISQTPARTAPFHDQPDPEHSARLGVL